MRAILFAIVGAAMLTASFLAISFAMTPRECDGLAQWVYRQAEARDAGVARADHEAAVREANAGAGSDMVALLVRELGKVYAEGKEPIVAAMESRFECYSRKGAVGVEAKGGEYGRPRSSRS